MTSAAAGGRTPVLGLKARVLLLSFALATGLGLCEVAARMVFPEPPQLGREPQLRYQSDPDLGFVHVPDQRGYLDDGLASINRLGFRGSEPELPKPPDTIRVVTIGDSTTFGWGVNDGETYPAQLEALLERRAPDRRVSVVNAAVSSYDLHQSARRLAKLAPVLRPDIVLVGFFWNDLALESRSPEGGTLNARAGAPRAASSDGARETPSMPQTFRMANQPTGFRWLFRQSRLLFALRHAWLAAIAPTNAAASQVRWELALLEGQTSPAIDEAWRDVEDTLGEIGSLGAAGGFAVGVVILPIRAQVEQHYPDAAYQTRIRAIAEAQGFFVVDPLPTFLTAPARARLFIPYDRIHLSAKGNALLAEAALEALSARPEFLRRQP